MSRRRSASRIDVKVGQVYAARATTKGARARYVRIVGVSKGMTDRGQQPRISWREITSGGNLKGRKSDAPSTTVLTFDRELNVWVMPSRYELDFLDFGVD